MNQHDIEDENLQILLNQWRKLTIEKIDCTKLNLSQECADVLVKLNESQIRRAANVDVPLFQFACTSESLKQALSTRQQHGIVEHAVDEGDALVFLMNRWKASSDSFVSVQLLYNISRKMHGVIRSATVLGAITAANAGIQLMRLSVRPQYFFHTCKLDMSRGQRTSLAICNADRFAL